LIDAPAGERAALGDRIVFGNGSELWLSDGTPGGTRPFLDFGPGSGFYGLTTVGDRIYFNVVGQTEQSGIWVTDGTDDGTRRFLVGSPFARGFIQFGDRLLFDSDSGLWFSDGTPEGSGIFWSNPPPGPGEDIMIFDMAPLGNRLLFSASDPDHGQELWTSDGTPEGTVLLEEIWPGQGGSGPSSFTLLGDRLFFSASDPDHGRELWSSDGTAEGTFLVADLAPGSEGSSPGLLAAAGQRLFFLAFSHPNLPQNLWASDGTEAGTRFLREFPPFTLDRFEPFGALGGRIFFLVGNGTHELWTSDGTPAGTALFRTGIARLMGMAGDLILFTVWDPMNGEEIWVTDGTEESTKLLYQDGILGVPCGEFDKLGAKLFITALQPEHGNELWVYDGTTGTMVPIDIVPGGVSSFPRFLTADGNRLFFVAYGLDDGCAMGGGPPLPCFESCLGNDRDLWISDGTPEGTRLIGKDIVPAQELPWGHAAARDRLFFAGLDSEHGDEPWVSDGTPSGTRMLADLVQGTGGSSPDRFVAAGDRLFFTAAGMLWTLPLEDGPRLFRRGDSNADGATDISDAVAILGYLFLGEEKVPCEQAGDANDDGALDISDAVYILEFLFLGGQTIEPPVEECGIDPTPDELACLDHPVCQ
jgi:ELWxxDGT repeat protein